MTLNIGMIVEIALMGLLAVTLVYCIVLERRLRAVRSEQKGLRAIIADLNTAIANAASSIKSLKTAAAGAADTLDERLARARAAIDELSLLTASGERIAERFDRTATEQSHARAALQKNPNLPSGSVMGRLDALRAVR